jgi:hypothetical protein
MAGLTLEQAQELFNSYHNAELAVLSGKSYVIGGRQLTRENLSEIRKGRKEAEGILNRLTLGISGPRVMRVVPR